MSDENSDADDDEDIINVDDEEQQMHIINVLDELLGNGNNSDDDDEMVIHNDGYANGDEAVEIVNDSDTDESELEIDDEARRPFDTTLPSSHSYMGDDMEDLHGRTIHCDGEIILLPLFYRRSLVLVPGQILPLNLFHPQLISMMKKVIAGDKTFGLMFERKSDDDGYSIAPVGVTCEIFSVKEETNHGVTQMSIKAEGRQRFKIISKKAQLDGVIMGKIKILPDAYISQYPSSGMYFSQPHSPNFIRSQLVSHHFYLDHHAWTLGESRYMAGITKKKAHMMCTSLTHVHGWVYKLYNPYYLMDRLLTEIHSWNQNINFDTLPTNPIEFSHWVTANLPFTNRMKVELLEIDPAPLRMRRQIDFMNKCAATLACVECDAIIANKNDLFSLSCKGLMAAYVNPGGHVHETVTFYTAKNLFLTGRRSTQYSWFPGYAWTIASCENCHNHMGWKFTAAKKGLNPSKFWGLTRASLKPVFKETVLSDELEKVELSEVAVTEDHNTDTVEPTSNPVQYESNI